LKINTVEASVRTNIPKTARKKKMGVSEKGMLHVVRLLSNLYKDPELAVIREYYTNAIDAHKEAGVLQPVLVSLPTWDNPVYTVQDFGVGMSEDTLYNVYSEYGESSKQESDEFVGAFGLGSKSAFAIATQFTVVSVKDGLKTTGLASKAGDGSFDFVIISSVPTTEGNGTTIKVPVKSNLDTFRSTASTFFQYSPPGSVLVDGREPEYRLKTIPRMENPKNPDMELYIRAKIEGPSYVIMGMVPYELSHSEIDASLGRLKVKASKGFSRMPKYIVAPIGSVDLTPAREGLMFTDMTNNFIDAHISFLVNDLKDIAQAEMNTANTLEEFLGTYKRWNDIVEVPRIWNGEVVPKEVSSTKFFRTIERSSWGTASHAETNYLYLDRTTKYIVITGYSADDYKKVNNYLTPYMTSEGLSHVDFLITDEQEFIDNKWLKLSSRFTFVSGADVIEKGKAQRKKERGTVKKNPNPEKMAYPVIFMEDEELRWTPYDEIPEDAAYLSAEDVESGSYFSDWIKGIYSSSWTDRDLHEEYVTNFQTVTDEQVIVLLGKSRKLDAFQKRCPAITKNIKQDILNTIASSEALITPDVLRFHRLSSSGWGNVLKATGIDKNISRISDPYLYQIVVPKPEIGKAVKRYDSIRTAARFFRVNGSKWLNDLGYHQAPQDVAEWTKKLDDKYPLIGHIALGRVGKTQVEHIIKYLNMIHLETLDDAVKI